MEKNKGLGRKGNVDLFYIIAALFAISIMVLVMYKIVRSVDDSGLYDSSPDAKQISALGNVALLSFDNIMLFVIVGLSLFVILSSAFIWNHPAFFILGIILLTIAIMVAGVVSNAWYSFSSNPQIIDATTAYPKINFLMKQLPFYILFMGIASLISSVVGYRRFA